MNHSMNSKSPRRPLRLLFAAGAVAVVAAPLANANAAITLSKPSELFDRKYEMDVEPSTQDLDGNSTLDFVKNATGSATATPGTPSAGFVTLSSSGGDNIGYNSDAAGRIWREDNYLETQGFTVEVRLRVVSQSGSDAAFGITTTPAGSNIDSYFIIRATGQAWSITNGAASPSVPLNIGAQLDNTDGFHVFRLAFDPATLRYSMWRDAVLLADGASNSTFGDMFPSINALNRLQVGDNGGFFAGVVELDYVRFTRGAFLTPEPASAAMLALGGLATLRRRRK